MLDLNLWFDLNGQPYEFVNNGHYDFITPWADMPGNKLIFLLSHNYDNQVDEFENHLQDNSVIIITNAVKNGYSHPRVLTTDFLFNLTRAYYSNFKFSRPHLELIESGIDDRSKTGLYGKNTVASAMRSDNLLNNISSGDANNTPIGQIISNFNKLNQINDAIITQAEIDVPKSGSNIDPLYVEPLNPDGSPGDPTGTISDMTNLYASSISDYSSQQVTTPKNSVPAYLGGDGNAPNGFPVVASTSFPGFPAVGDYCLRTDYIPNRLFRWNGSRWIKIEDNVRTDLTPGPNNQTQRSIFVNNTDTFTNDEGQTVPVRQRLSKALTPKADN